MFLGLSLSLAGIPFLAPSGDAGSTSGLIYAEGTRLMKDGAPLQLFGTNDNMALVYTHWGDYGRNYMFPVFDGRIPGVSSADQFWKEYFRHFLHYQQVASCTGPSACSPRPNLFRPTVGWDFGSEDAYYAWKNDPSTYFANFDAMVRWAKAAGVYLVPALMQSPNDRSFMWEYFDTSSNRYRHLVEYERAIMARYASEPQIAMWDLFNEADVSCVGCPAGNANWWPSHGGFNAFKAWEQTLANDVRSATSHLITIGHAMTSAEHFFPNDGFSYDRNWYMQYSDIQGVDVSQVHWYATAEDQYLVDWLAGWARELGKPMFIGELGYNPYPSPTGAPVPYGHWPWYLNAWRSADVGPVADMTWLDNGRGPYADYPYGGALPDYPPSSEGPVGIPTNAFRGQYYDGANLTDLKVERIDPAINFQFGSGSPDASIAPDNFSARWEGRWTFGEPGTYRFTMKTDDGMRVWVDNQILLDEWKQQPPTTYVVNTSLASGIHSIRVEWNDLAGDAVAVVSWTLGTRSSWLPPWLVQPQGIAAIAVVFLALVALGAFFRRRSGRQRAPYFQSR